MARFVRRRPRRLRRPRVRRFRRSRRSRRRVLSRSVRLFMRPELKYIAAESNGTLSSTMTFTSLFFPIQGTDASQRIGNKVLIRKMEFRFNLVNQASSATTLSRFFVFFVRNPNLGDTVPFAADIFPSGTSFYNTALYSMTTISPYNVVFDKSVTTHAGTDRTSKQFWFVTKRPFGVQFGANNGTVADIVKNALYLGGWSNQATNTPTLYMTYRILYQDC